MSSSNKSQSFITHQLDLQNISYQVLSEEELKMIEFKWKEKFINKKTAPDLDKFKWHIFSFFPDKKNEGNNAILEYKKQYASDIYIFNERLEYGLKIISPSILPNIILSDFIDDVYICHYNMKWTYVIPHEYPEMGPYFKS
ncbi:MAG: DUF4275 family protein [Bacteroidota bacterium]|nr:DUF4275 family protein [Bacteroidota bacterium]MDP3145049.1 DUF4275 family protein [Bacteroidota bacterium]MDP3556081.1 DUF4275 family protein [Bacteroidota bacterium]